jgi:RNA polymerase sigma-54 factor
MAIGPRLDLRQAPALVMTPQLQQALKLLQMSNLELSVFVEQEIERNPFLDRDDSEGGNTGTTAEEPPAAPEGDAGSRETSDDEPAAPDTVDLAGAETFVESESAALDADFENVWEAQSASDGGPIDGAGYNWGNPKPSGGGDDDAPDLENLMVEARTLRQHLLEQVSVDLNDPVDRMIAAHLIDLLDDSGYLVADLSQVAAALGCELERVEQTLHELKSFEPPGIFASNLAECLLLQLRDRGQLTRAMRALLENLDLLAKRSFDQLRRKCRVTEDELAEMVNIIRTLNPKPASAFDREVIQPITPDVLVRPHPEGGWAVELNSETLPRVLVNNRYYAVVRARAREKTEQEYLIDCLQSANWLVKSLQQRAQTILKVATEIVRQQEEFFAKGVQYLRPLTLHNVATEVGVHESTVSRVTNNKYLGTARGIYELKYFFSGAIGQSVDGVSFSAESIRFKIRNLIDNESVDNVLSDDMIVDILSKSGVEIARRTVAKYRESMQIPSSMQRRREKSLQRWERAG